MGNVEVDEVYIFDGVIVWDIDGGSIVGCRIIIDGYIVGKWIVVVGFGFKIVFSWGIYCFVFCIVIINLLIVNGFVV